MQDREFLELLLGRVEQMCDLTNYPECDSMKEATAMAMLEELQEVILDHTKTRPQVVQSRQERAAQADSVVQQWDRYTKPGGGRPGDNGPVDTRGTPDWVPGGPDDPEMYS